TDSVPMPLISGQVPIAGRGIRSGYYHENEQLEASTSFTKWRQAVEHPNDVVQLLDQAFAAMLDRRPGPALLDVPVDVLAKDVPRDVATLHPTVPVPPRATSADISSLVETVLRWQKPLILAGGGVISGNASALLLEIAERLGAPVFHSL